MATMKSCLLDAVGILLTAGGVTAAEAQTIVAPDVVQPPAAAAVVTTVPSATVVAQTTPVETTHRLRPGIERGTGAGWCGAQW